MLLNERATFDLAVRLRAEGAPLGDVYSFISGLYFRGKMAYSAAFAAPPEGVPSAVVITPGAGLIASGHDRECRDDSIPRGDRYSRG